ncbi:MAG: MFS transporter [Albidovulum sp.]|nr:MFS transporter [Albidovulum sp.]
MSEINDSRAKRNVAVLVLAQALLGAQLPMIFIVGGLAGMSLAPNPCWATLPISLIVFGSMTTATWLSPVMQKYGRKLGFFIGSAGGCAGAIIGAYALTISSFPLFLVGSWFTGIYMSAHGFYRFAAADTASENFKPKAISYVMAGGLAAAIIGPQLATLTSESFAVPFLGTYFTIISINLVGSVFLTLLDLPTVKTKPEFKAKQRSYAEILKTPGIVVSILCAMVSYALMNLVMTATPLAIVGCGYGQANAANVVSAHVFSMFAPSFFTGHFIARFGAKKIVATGLALLACAGITGLADTELVNFYLALALLGIGWNFGFIGATAMLVNEHEPHERGRVQGLNDACVFGFVTLGSLASGILMNCSGSTAEAGWMSVNFAMAPLLLVAGVSLAWLAFFGSRGRLATKST